MIKGKVVCLALFKTVKPIKFKIKYTFDTSKMVEIFEFLEKIKKIEFSPGFHNLKLSDLKRNEYCKCYDS